MERIMKSCALVAPSYKVSQKEKTKAIRNLKKEKTKAVCLFNQGVFFDKWAETPNFRRDSIHKAFTIPVDYIRAIKGGTGTIHFLSDINFNLLKKKPKFFVGYSDITPILNLIYERTGIIALHGPHVLKDLDKGSLDCLKQALQAKTYSISFKDSFNISSSKISGIVKGGNIALCTWCLGSSFELDLKNKIVFFEDVDIDEFQFYDQLTQLKNSKNFKPKALVFGYVDKISEKIFLSMLKNLFPNIPILYGVKSGHQLPNYTIPIGAEAILDFKKKLIHFRFPNSAKKYALKF